MSEKYQCHECSSENITSFEEYAELPRVTSDCKPWPAGGTLLLCCDCGLVQAHIDPKWQGEVGRIYSEYDCHYQSGGADQHVYDEATGKPVKRSEKLLSELKRRALLEPAGTMVDVGCGSGAFLKMFGSLFPEWRLYGLEQAPKYEETIRSIPGVADFFPVGLDELEGHYSLITLIHVFEHIPQPGLKLRQLSEQLNDDGHIFIQVPSYEENPFELLVADHSAHFSGRQLLRVVQGAGSLKKHDELRWLPKELSLLSGKVSEPVIEPVSPEEIQAVTEKLESTLAWLKQVAETGRSLSSHPSFGVFGTSIAATWFIGVAGAESVQFFVDEDPSRIGKSHFGKPILSPDQVPENSQVFIPLAPVVAGPVAKRLEAFGIEAINPAEKFQESGK